MTPAPKLPVGGPLGGFLQWVVRALEERTPINGDVKWDQTSKGFRGLIPEATVAAKAPGATIHQNILTGVFDDYLTVQRYNNGAASGSTINVAKPFDLRRTPFDNKSLSFNHEVTNRQITISWKYQSAIWRTVTRRLVNQSNTTTEDEVIIPRYVIGTTIIYSVDAQESLGIAPASGSVSEVEISNGRSFTRIIS